MKFCFQSHPFFWSYNNEAKEIDQSPKSLANYRRKNLSSKQQKLQH